MSEDERILADQIAAHVQQQIDGLPRKPQTLAQQLWAIYFGVTANEFFGHARPTNGACASCTSFTRDGSPILTKTTGIRTFGIKGSLRHQDRAGKTT